MCVFKKMMLVAAGSRIICCPWFRKCNAPWGLGLSSDARKGGKAGRCEGPQTVLWFPGLFTSREREEPLFVLTFPCS